jgi:haloalkane dehalogenase
MIPLVASAGHRVLAPDLIGFGKSDKPASVTDYSYGRHLAWLTSWLEQLDLTNITLVCQNWGSLLGLRLAAEHRQRFSRIIVGNGMLPTGEAPVPAVFSVWKAFATHSPWFPVGRIVQLGTAMQTRPPGRCLNVGKSRLSPVSAVATPLPGAATGICSVGFPVPMANPTSRSGAGTSCRKIHRKTSPALSSMP